MTMIPLFLISIAILLAMLAMRAPVALSLAAAGLGGLLLHRGPDMATTVLGSVPFQSSARTALVVIPMFVLMGVLAEKAGIAEDVLSFMNRLLRRLPGGLGMATVAACATFGAVSGSSIAAAATMGRPSIREMRRYGYSRELSSGVVAVAGTLSVMIPPSIVLVLYGIITGESVGALLLAGIVPGTLSAIALMTGVALLAKFGPKAMRVDQNANAALEEGGGISGTTARELIALVKVFILFAIVIGGIYGGFLTPSEAAGVGAFGALLLLLTDVVRDGIGPVLRRTWEAFTETAVTTAFIFAILVGAGLYTFFLVSIGVPAAFADWATALQVPGWVIVAILLLLMVPLGMFLDPMSILLIVVPLAYPVVDGLGYDGIWFAILVVKMIEIGLITPPVGLNVFVVADTPGITVESVFRGIMYFLPIEIVIVVLLFAFPEIVAWLPSLMG